LDSSVPTRSNSRHLLCHFSLMWPFWVIFSHLSTDHSPNKSSWDTTWWFYLGVWHWKSFHCWYKFQALCRLWLNTTWCYPLPALGRYVGSCFWYWFCL
jgi:hypothetical protein